MAITCLYYYQLAKGRSEVCTEAFKEILSEAAEKEEDTLPELILLDLMMPVMDGFEFLEAYHQLPGIQANNTSIYVVTSSDYPKDIQRAKDYKVAGFINKPMNNEKGLKIIADRLSK